MNDPYVRYGQRVRFFFYSCKESLSGRSRLEMTRRFDAILNTALLQKEEWHGDCLQLFAEAVAQQMLHHTDGEFFSTQMRLCVPAKGDKPPAPAVRKLGRRLAY